MLTKKLRKQIEGHFYNYKENLNIYNGKVRDILESGLTADLESIGRSHSPGNPTEIKALKLAALDGDRTWEAVVHNTFNAFRFEPEYAIMVELYIKGRKRKELFCNGLWENTFYRWREKWLEHAYMWAKEFKLI